MGMNVKIELFKFTIAKEGGGVRGVLDKSKVSTETMSRATGGT